MEAARLAHRIRGAAANLGAERLQAAAQALERDLEAKDIPGSEHDLLGFRRALDEVMTFIETPGATMNEPVAEQEAPPMTAGRDDSIRSVRDPAGRPSILLVDDEPTHIHLLKAILEDTYEVLSARNGRDALRIAAESMPDLVLLDVIMPEMDGYEVCRRLQADPLLRSLPVIFVTAQHKEADEAAGLALGAVDYVIKPFNPTIVRLRVRSHIASKQQRDQLTQLSQLDALTGVANRRAVDETLEREWRRGLRSRRPLSLAMIDIDQFKSYNDGLGHLAGDECLQKVARALQSRLQRAGDRLGRYGGDEFLAILPDTDPAGARAVGQEMCAAVVALQIPHPFGSGSFITVSVGVATAQVNRQHSLTDLRQAGDNALYEAKRGGRNRVEAATEMI
jgi:diguanylate cyclase (GGDEF)-like protein